MKAAAQCRVAVITGASAGIGAATSRALAAAGYELVLGARRLDRLREVADPLGARALPLDVTDRKSVEDFAAAIARCDVLVANAGKALGTDRIETAREDLWETMFRTNVLGVLYTVRALLPKLEASGDGLVVILGSIAGFETYRGGAGYTASKHALRAVIRTLRLELLGRPVRVTEIAPGLVETEFSLVRFEGDAGRAKKVYEGMEPLTADDVAECVRWVCSLPSRVDVDEIVVRPRDQATATEVHRRPAPAAP
ncbi:MAG TPA: SDR family NAD(P)-dependent oxidoreductase [Thermoanaerobaculia bacterium]|nr:SDR family NAD(P)-dependent oxidoreductase [Thermoanaerobaculia bacterium]